MRLVVMRIIKPLVELAVTKQAMRLICADIITFHELVIYVIVEHLHLM